MRWTFCLLLAGCDSGLGARDAASDLAADGSADTGEGPDTAVPGTEDPNGAPTADAGLDVSVPLSDAVILDGARLTDPDGDVLSFAWELVSIPIGSDATLLDEAGPTPQFWVDRPGPYTARLTVSDGALSATDDVVVQGIAENGDPLADAGPDQSVLVGDTVLLNGSGSFDPNNNALVYDWRFTSVPYGSAASLTDATTVLPTFTADLPGLYVVELTVSDGAATSGPDETIVEARSAGSSDCGSCLAPGQVAKRVASGHATLLVLLPFALIRRRQPAP